MGSTRYLLGSAILVALLSAVPSVASDDFEVDELIISLVPGASIDDVNARWGFTTISSYTASDLYLVDTNGASVPDIDDAVEADPDVLEVDANYIESTPETVRQMVLVAVGGSLSEFEDQQIAERVGVDEAHSIATGAGVIVAVIDTGIDTGHEVFTGNLLPGFDFVDDDTDPFDEGNGIDDDGDGVIDASRGHGTMVAGIVSLVAPDATILPIRAIDDEGRSNAWLLSVATRYAVDQGADVINMSFGAPTEVDALHHEIERAESFGVAVVAAAGNESRTEPAYHPASSSKTFMVVATDAADVKADFSDWHDDASVAAPGVGVRSAYPGGWAIGDGCSFAAPFVTGEIALIRQHWPDLTEESLEARVQSAVEPIDHLPGNALFAGRLGSGRVYLPLALAGAVSVPTVADATWLRLAPNPTRGGITLHGDAFVSGTAAVSIFDVAGRRVRVLADGRRVWDGLDVAGDVAAPGTYFIRVVAGSRTTTRSIQVLP